MAGAVLKFKEKPKNTFVEASLSAEILEGKVFEKDNWLVEGLVPKGLSLLVGDSKIGKSFLALQLSLAVAKDGVFLGSHDVNPGEVLYVTWEDGEQRVQERIRKSGEGFPKGLFFNFNPTVSGNDLWWLDEWLDVYADTRLVVLDTLAYLRFETKSRADAYIKDVKFMEPFHAMASDRKLSILGVTHTNQLFKTTDDFQKIQGSTGQPGTADNIIFLSRDNRSSENGKLRISGRDIEEMTLSLRFDKETCVWSEIEDIPADPTTADRILGYLRESPTPVTPSMISQGIGIKNVKTQLKRLLDKGMVQKCPGGCYRGVTLQ